MQFSQHYLYRCTKKGSKELFVLCCDSIYKCKSELFNYLCKETNCQHEVKTWRFLIKFCEKNNIPLSISPKHDFATFENWIYFIA